MFTRLSVALLIPVAMAAIVQTPMTYPNTRKADQVDDYHGTTIADPYRWLEDDDSAETKAWVEAQNAVTFGFFERVPERDRIRRRLTELWDFERYGAPSKEGSAYVFSRNDGLQNQAVVYKAAALDAEPEVLIDPNTLSTDGTVALSAIEFTDDGRLMAYATSSGGSDWTEWRVRDVGKAEDLADVVRWSKFSGAAWRKDGSGFYYGRYAEPQEGDELTELNKNQKLYFHRVGSSQEDDALIFERPDRPEWMFSPGVTDDGRFLVVYQDEGTEPKNRIFLQDLTVPGGPVDPFLDRYDAEYYVVGNDGDRFYVRTDKDAPRGRLVAIERGRPSPADWKTLIPEPDGRDVLAGVSMVGERFVAIVQTNAHEKVRIHALDGAFEREVPLPGVGTVGGFTGRRSHHEGFFAFTSYTTPTSTYRYDFRTGQCSVFRQPKVPFDPSDYMLEQVWYASKDGTRVPMFLSHRKGLEKNGRNPTLLYGYGGFNVSLTPAFSPAVIAWLEMGGVYAVANLRGGGEFGKQWHDAGRLANKQNVFDDFIAGAEHLIRESYTSTPKLAINGGSNGGLLVAAVANQRPDLFGAVVADVGVMDMLRFHQFTIGWAWVSDYGSAENEADFDVLIKYSPLHNIEPGTKYPATLVTTADHDDRVVPAHSFKYAAALQAAQSGPAPILIRIETRAGHGAGKPTTKVIEERVDRYAFLAEVLGMDLPPRPHRPSSW